MRRLILRWLINAVAVYAAMFFVPGISATNGVGVFLWMALILGLVNALIAPLIKLLTCPLIILSLGIFTLVINGLMFWLAGQIAASLGIGFFVQDFGAAFWGALVVSAVSFALSVLTGVNRRERRR
ncbi:MAG TPA: phage holin family protein [Chloroflexi bacterium]|jgi:putative membrane protein|nr:phage holin family protein [Chloroflexota bacterium]